MKDVPFGLTQAEIDADIEGKKSASDNILRRPLTLADADCLCMQKEDHKKARQQEKDMVAYMVYLAFVDTMSRTDLCFQAGIDAAAMSLNMLLYIVSTGLLGFSFTTDDPRNRRPTDEEIKIARGSLNLLDLVASMARERLNKVLAELESKGATKQ